MEHALEPVILPIAPLVQQMELHVQFVMLISQVQIICVLIAVSKIVFNAMDNYPVRNALMHILC